MSLEPLEERRLLAIMTVTDLGDDTLANLMGDNQLSLREAIEAINTGANVDSIGPTSGVFGTNDEIRFAPALFTGGPGTIPLADTPGELKLLKSMTITGPGASLLTIDAGDGADNTFNTGDGFRIFNVDDGNGVTTISATLTGLKLTGGDVTGEGGAIRAQFENLAVRDCVITGNAAVGGAGNGGGIYANTFNDRDLEITRTTISRNRSGNGGGGIIATGSIGTIAILDSIISQNEAATLNGGGLDLSMQSGGTITVTNTTVSGNTAMASGGGLRMSVSGAATANISNSTFSNNFVGVRGGGIYISNPGGAVTILSSTISGNRADLDAGGISANNGMGFTTTIAHSTITRNVSDDNAAGGGSGGGLFLFGAGTVALDHTIVADNFDGSAVMANDIDATTFATGAITAEFSLIGDNTGSGLTAGNPIGMGNKIGTGAAPIDPLLGPLQPNGGPTQTHALFTGSPALDAGDPTAVADMGGIPEFDQRGNTFTRVFDGAAPAGAVIDIGAYELQNLGAPQALVVDILADENDGDYSPGDLSLREAIGLANGNVGFADTITFASGLNGGTILLVRGELGITEELTINATSLTSGITIDASGNDPTPGTNDDLGSRIFNINDGDEAVDNRATLIGLTLTGGDADGFGGAIASVESLTLRNSVITGNAADTAGGIGLYQYSTGAPLTHEITGSTISGNSATSSGGGGIFMVRGTTTINNSTISGNSASADPTFAYAGGIGLRSATCTITNSTISGNTTSGSGGGLYMNYGTATIVNSTFSDNRADLNGGGLTARFFGADQSLTISHSTFTQNVADDDNDDAGTGGGIFLGDPPGNNGTFTLTHTIVAENFDRSDAAPDMDATTNPATTFTRTFNLIGIGSNSGVTNGVMGNQVGSVAVPLDPQIGALVDNGGPTLTHALDLDSPAVDGGDTTLDAGVGGVPEFDQRGNPFTRVFDGNDNGTSTIDIGAYEITAFEMVAPDDFEPNDTLQTATILGSPPFETIRDLSITAGNGDNIPDDIDYFKYTAHYTGQLRVRIHFPDDFGDLDLQVRDMFDNIIAFSNGFTDLEEVIIPVVFQEMYFIRVIGFGGDANNYTLEVENFPAPVPTGVVLDPASDTGMMDNDNVTSDDTPTIFIQTDVLNFVDTNNNGLFQDPDANPPATADKLDALSPDEANRILNNTPAADDEDGGIAVEVTFVNTTDGTFVTGFAEAVIGALPDVYRFTPSAPLTPGVYLVTARTRVFDGQADANDDPDQETGRSNASPPLRLVIDTTGAALGSVSADMLNASDTGMRNDDNVTNKMQPAFNGIAPAGAKVRLFANGELVGQTVAGSDTSDVGHAVGGIGGLANDGLGLWEITSEPLADNGYDIRIEVEDAAGNVSLFNPQFNGPNQPIDIVVDTQNPNLPYLDLIDDTGRHDNDNITKDNTPRVTMTSTDPNIALAQLLFQDNLKFRIYDRYENAAEFKLYDSALDTDVDAVSVAADMFTSLTFIEEGLPDQFFALFGGAANAAVIDLLGIGRLADGVHNLKLVVEDRAGNFSHEFLLEITVDTVTPPVSFGLPDGKSEVDGLAASSDTGVVTMPMTYADRVTSDTTPTLWGRAEANSIVRVYYDTNQNNIIDFGTDIFLGQSVALPFDGNDAYPKGFWELTTVLDLNEIDAVSRDGLRQLLVTAEDVAGNPMKMDGVIEDGVDVLQIFIDTQGPRIRDVNLGPEIDYDLFDPKPSEDGPTPLIHSLFIDIKDFPARLAPDFLYEAIKEDIAEIIGNYELIGDNVGQVIIEEVIVHFETVVSGQPARASIELVFAQPLPDDRYTFTVRDNIVDPAGNKLDGESGNSDPLEDPNFPTGDGVPGGNFVARFTVDSRPEIGVWAAGIIHIDTNGNFHFDPENLDFTNRDLVYTLGFSSDYIFAGNFVLGDDDNADGFDKLAVYGRIGDQWRFLIDTTNDGVPDHEFLAPPINGIPVAGNFDGNLDNGDEVGIFTGSVWYFDTDHDFIVDTAFAASYAGFPVVGDFDADGDDDVATYIASQAGGNFFHIDINTAGLGSAISINGSADHTFRVGVPGLGTFGFAGVRERPVAADMNGDGADDLGLWVPDGTAILPGDQGEWFFLLSDSERIRYENGAVGLHINQTVIDRIQVGGIVDFVPFSTTPFGEDLYARFGNSFALPIVGNFDPPTSPRSASTQQTASTPSPTSTPVTSESTTTQRAGLSS
ncbi:MAG: Ig-like domain-containing protein, partial [Pirellulales bacterium]